MFRRRRSKAETVSTVPPPPDAARAQPVADRAGPSRIHFLRLLAMDLVARTGYQMGKSPLLPLFAAALGAGSEMTGIVVAISTTTGLITTPLIGTLSDRYGRRRLLLFGTAIFAFVPFVYLLVHTPGQLLLVRVIHGFATATYGPVVAALVADLFPQRRAEHMGWYRSARTASYLLGPLLGGAVLFYADFRLAWVSVGALGLIAFLPAIVLPQVRQPTSNAHEEASTREFIRQHLLQAFGNPVLLALGAVEAALYLGLRANKTFLPLYALSVGINPAQVGLIFSVQVAATLLAQPLGGYLAERMGRKPAILAGLLLVGSGLPLMVMAHSFPVLALLSVALGLGEAAVMPAVITLGTELSAEGNYGSTLGMLDAMDNVGKALGPVVAGLLLAVFDYTTSFAIVAGILVAAAAAFYVGARDLG